MTNKAETAAAEALEPEGGMLALAEDYETRRRAAFDAAMNKHHVWVGLPVLVKSTDANYFNGCEVHAAVITLVDPDGKIHVHCMPAFRAAFNIGGIKHESEATGAERFVWAHIMPPLTETPDAAQP